MVDVQARQQAADLIEKFRDGTISNFEFQDSYPRYDRRDRALRAIETFLWMFYDDCREHTLVEPKHALTPAGRELFERCALFLRTQLEYQWPEDNFIGIDGLGVVPRILTLGLSWLLDRALRRRNERKLGRLQLDESNPIWPFFTMEEYSLHRG